MLFLFILSILLVDFDFPLNPGILFILSIPVRCFRSLMAAFQQPHYRDATTPVCLCRNCR